MKKKKKIYIAVFVLLILSTGMGYFIYAKKTSNVDSEQCLKNKQIAMEDVKNGVAKYYHFGFVPLHDEKLIKILTEKKVKIINKNCVVIPELMCYNQEVFKELHINK